MLARGGAFEFALREGFAKTDLLMPAARRRWSEWRNPGGNDEARLGISTQSQDPKSARLVEYRSFFLEQINA